MAKPFLDYTYDDALELFGPKDKRRTVTAQSATAFFLGDAWQGNKGFTGQLPPVGYPAATQIEADIKKRFESENEIKKVIDRHNGGLLGREPLWSFLKEATGAEGPKKKEKDDATGDMLTPWWNENEALKDLQKASEMVLLEGRAVKRIFLPKGLLPEGGQLTAANVNKALDFIFFETLTADTAGVFTDPDTQKQIGIYLFEEKDDEGTVTDSCAELSFLDDDGNTVSKIVRAKGHVDEFGPHKLGGRLLIHEIERSPLITEAVQSNQKALNLAHTMMTRNVTMAGARERTVTNAQPPKRPIRRQDPANPSKTTETLEPGVHETGGQVVMYLMGYPIYDDDGNVTGYTNPGVEITDPSSVEIFVHTRETKRAAILSQCDQEHILITGDATASGVSRKQAEKSYQRSLKETKTVIDAAGRWELEVTLRLAAQIANQSDKYIQLRADFNCLVDAGEPDSEDLRVIMEMREPKGATQTPLISDQTARTLARVEDPEAEKKRIEEEAQTRQQNTLNNPLTNVGLAANTGTPAIRTLFNATPPNQLQ